MDQVSCEVVADLLPLYADGACSGGSRALVESHLAGCAQCARKLAEMGDDRAEQLVEADAQRQLKELARRHTRRRVSVLAALVVLVGLLCTMWVLYRRAEAEAASFSCQISRSSTYDQIMDGLLEGMHPRLPKKGRYRLRIRAGASSGAIRVALTSGTGYKTYYTVSGSQLDEEQTLQLDEGSYVLAIYLDGDTAGSAVDYAVTLEAVGKK